VILPGKQNKKSENCLMMSSFKMNKLLFDDMMGWFTLAIFFRYIMITRPNAEPEKLYKNLLVKLLTMSRCLETSKLQMG